MWTPLVRPSEPRIQTHLDILLVLDTANNIINSEFARVTYTEAIGLLEKSNKSFEYPVAWGIDMQSEHERWLAEEYFRKPVIVTNYPTGIKAFYMRLGDGGETVSAMDILAPKIWEIIGGSQREERLDVLESRIRAQGLDPEIYWWYLDLQCRVLKQSVAHNVSQSRAQC